MTAQFTFDNDANGYVSDAMAVNDGARIHIELSGRAPVVILKRENDGGYANYGQTPESGDAFEFVINSKEPAVIKLATPVAVKKFYVLGDTVPIVKEWCFGDPMPAVLTVAVVLS